MTTRFTLLILSCIFILFTASCTIETINDIEKSSVFEMDATLFGILADASGGIGANFYKQPDSDDFNAIPQDPNNPLTPEKVALGQLLFHETGLALGAMHSVGQNSYSCASCHHAPGGFQACLPQGIGDGGEGFGSTGEGRIKNNTYNDDEIDVQQLRSPSILNTAYQKNMLWNGQFGATDLNVGTEYAWADDTPPVVNNLGFEGLESQAIAGFGIHRMTVEESLLLTDPTYLNLFDTAFPSYPEAERITDVTVGLAMAAFERTVLANKSPFQRWLHGDFNAMTIQEKEGAILFFGKANCSSCHNGPALNSMAFYALGMNDLNNSNALNINPNDAAHLGRGGFTNKPEDNYKFKVPQLYNLKSSPFYGHGASFTSVKDVIRYKNEAIAENTQVPNEQIAEGFVPLLLNEQEITAITTFIENALYDPQLSRYEPANLPSGNCFPNNDSISSSDLGCD